MDPALATYLGLIGFSVLGTGASRMLSEEPLWVARIAAMLTLALGTMAVLRAYESRWIAALGVVVLGAGSEILGLYTGFPFGSYSYTDAWWPTVPMPRGHQFPLLLPWAWLMVVGAAHLTLVGIPSRWLRAVSTGLLAAVVDILMEPVMVDKLGYWVWDPVGPLPGGAPITNFFGWWLVGTLAGWSLPATTNRHAAEVGWGVLAGHVLLMVAMLLLRPSLGGVVSG